jgi:hypothetical protein
MFEGSNYDVYKKLLSLPPVKMIEVLSLADVVATGTKSSGQMVNLLVLVRLIKPKKDITVVKTKQVKSFREVIVMDKSCNGLSLKFWSTEYIERANTWKPLETVLMLADVKMEYSTFYNQVCLVVCGKTIVCENPPIDRVRDLRNYAATNSMQPNDPVGPSFDGRFLFYIVVIDIDVTFFRDVWSGHFNDHNGNDLPTNNGPD